MNQDKYTYNVTGCSTVHDLIAKSIHAERVLDRNPNTLMLSKELARLMIREVENMNDHEFEEMDIWKRAIGSMIYGLKVFVVTNKKHDYIELFECCSR